jgi:NAD(P)H-hydrate epimerase
LINLIIDVKVMEFITPQEMIEAEKRASQHGITVEMLMENAGLAVAEEIMRRYYPLSEKLIIIVAGNGNNGGDGFVAARYISKFGAITKLILLTTIEAIKTNESRKNWTRLESTGVETHIANDLNLLANCTHIFEKADIILDAILGTGVKGEIKEQYAEAIRMINKANGLKIALDIPSGIDPLTGDVRNLAVKADLTITLHKAKIGLKERREYTGEIVVVPIGIP